MASTIVLLRIKQLSLHFICMKFAITFLLTGKLDENQSIQLSLFCCEGKVDDVWAKKDLFLGHEEEASSLLEFGHPTWYCEWINLNLQSHYCSSCLWRVCNREFFLSWKSQMHKYSYVLRITEGPIFSELYWTESGFIFLKNTTRLIIFTTHCSYRLSLLATNFPW